MNKAVGGDGHLRKAPDRFLDEHPRAKNMRDVLSHFDEYEAGKGDLQKSGEVGELTIFLSTGPDSVTLTLASNLSIEVSEASSAALELAEETLNAKERFVTRLQKERAATRDAECPT
jgi:hypothetical protein